MILYMLIPISDRPLIFAVKAVFLKESPQKSIHFTSTCEQFKKHGRRVRIGRNRDFI